MPAVGAPYPHPVDLGGASPVEVAEALSHLPGLAFFDSASESHAANPISIVSAAPSEIVSGHIDRDWDLLRQKTNLRAGDATADLGLPLGFAAGSVEYEGAFAFGLYDQALYYDHRSATWYELG